MGIRRYCDEQLTQEDLDKLKTICRKALNDLDSIEWSSSWPIWGYISNANDAYGIYRELSDLILDAANNSSKSIEITKLQ